MFLDICKWKNDADFPLIFMIDDLANIYFNLPGGDWGGKLEQAGGMFHYLKQNILHNFPDVKFTFFAVAGVRCKQVVGEYHYAQRCDEPQYSGFLKYLISLGHEISYHGFTHGSVSGNSFIQEWDAFETEQSAIDGVREGVDLLSCSIDSKVYGGKYCGYKPGFFGHASLKANGIRWWFDTWDQDHLERPHGCFIDKIFYMPSNIDCSNYEVDMFLKVPAFKYFKSIARRVISSGVKKKLKDLIDTRGIISLQEHSSPVRTDGVTQYPNIIHDLPQIKSILNIINEHNPWYATATEVYSYALLRESVKIESKGSSCSLIFHGSSEDAAYLLSRNSKLSIKTKPGVLTKNHFDSPSNKTNLFDVKFSDILNGSAIFSMPPD